MVERFFPLPNPTDMSSCRSRSDHPIILLSGPPSSGKTSLLFQYALNSALEFNGAVVFICSRHKLDTKPPFLSQGIDPSSDIFQRIHIKYIDDDEGIKRYFAAFHIHHVNPVSVIIDDFTDFFDERNCQQRYNNARGRDLAMVRTLALCRNAVDSAKESRPCQLLLSDTHQGDSPRWLYIYKRWVSSIYTIRGDGFGSFLLTKSNYFGAGKSDGITTAKYSIALQYLVLEGITEGGEQ
nr:putative P-loop containing nucleoside triphosphate hydrolase [Ipomoea batatas]